MKMIAKLLGKFFHKHKHEWIIYKRRWMEIGETEGWVKYYLRCNCGEKTTKLVTNCKHTVQRVGEIFLPAYLNHCHCPEPLTYEQFIERGT